MDRVREKRNLEDISSIHSYSDGFNGRLTRYRAKTIRALSKGGRALLDIGAGEGVLSKEISDKFDEAWIVEPSELYISKAKKMLQGQKVSYFNQLIEDFDTSEKFDLITASGILEHVLEPQKVLRKVKNWLSIKGIFIAIVPNARSLHRQIGLHLGILESFYALGEQDFTVGHRRYYDLSRLEKEISNAGLHIISSGGILLKPFPNTEMERLSEEYCDGLYEIGMRYPELCAEIFVACENIQ